MTKTPIEFIRTRGLTRSVFAGRKRWWDWVRISIQQLVLTKDIKNTSYYFYVRCATIICIGSKTGETYYHAKSGPTDKGRAIKECIVYLVILNLIPWVFGQIRRICLPLLNPLNLTSLCLGWTAASSVPGKTNKTS